MHRLFANIKKFVYLCTVFSVENDGCCCWQHGHTGYSNKTNLIRRNLASFMNRKKLANVSTHCVLLLLYLRFGQCESLCEDTTKVVFFCLCICVNVNNVL